jgi:hypothetical protein
MLIRSGGGPSAPKAKDGSSSRQQNMHDQTLQQLVTGSDVCFVAMQGVKGDLHAYDAMIHDHPH